MKASKQVALMMLLGATQVYAQSSVTLYGVMDMNVRRVSTGNASLTKVEPDGILGSRFGLKGEEDLGGGLKAAFVLESAVKPDTGVAGSSTSMFSRRATVSLTSKQLGEIRLGRDASTTWSNAVDFDHFGTGMGSLSKLFVPTTVNSSEIFGRRLDNGVNYFSPVVLGGFYGRLMWAPGEGAASGKTNGWRLGYQAGVVHVSAAGQVIKVAGGQFQQQAVGASYDFGVAKLIAQYVGSKTTVTGAKERVMELGTVIPVFDRDSMKFAYTKASESWEATKLTAGYLRDLSKRTTVYATWTEILNQNAAAAYAVESAPTATVGKQMQSSGFEVGIRHMF